MDQGDTTISQVGRTGTSAQRRGRGLNSYRVKLLIAAIPAAILANLAGFSLMALAHMQAPTHEAFEDLLVHTLLTTLAMFVAIALVTERMLATPMRRLIEAIRASQIEGSRQAVDWSSNDEIGELVDAFNEMQVRLAEGEIRRRNYNERLMRFYNRTPAMLFSVDSEGTLIHVSDHWLVATGYTRRDVIGQKLSRFLTPDSAHTYLTSVLPQFVKHGETPETPLRLHKWDGTTLDVVLTETIDQRIGGRFPLSLSVMTDISRTKAAERELVRLALTDPVTGLANRRGFVEGLDIAVASLAEQGGSGMAIFIDLDRFKRINDTHGHAAGDRLLVAIARRLAERAGPNALVGRLGGDEFALFVPFDPRTIDPLAFGEALLEEMRRPVDLGALVLEGGGSVGIALFPANGTCGGDLLSAADLALYRAKETGRGRVEMFDARLAQLQARRHEQEQDIRAALALGWFEPHLQPIVRLTDGAIAGAELLLRMRHPTKGLILPGDFIETAEESGLIEPIGRFVLETAARLTADLSKLSRDDDFFLSVNLSGGQVTPRLPDVLAELVERYRIRPESLVLEIIETAFLEEADAVTQILDQVSELGIRFALDDFGTGYSSLNYVQRFPVSMIKIDRSFTTAIGFCETDEDRRIAALVRTMVTLGSELGLPLVAEGIETEEEHRSMMEMGAGFGQGYRFAPPMPVRAFRDLLGAQGRTGMGLSERFKQAS